MIPLISFATAAISLKIFLSWIKHRTNKPSVLSLVVNGFRLFYSLTSSICLLLQKPVVSFIIFISGCGSYAVNVPITTFRIRKSKHQRITLNLLSDSFFLFPILSAFVILHTPEYLVFCRKFELNESYSKEFPQYPVSLILVYFVFEFWLGAYPQVRFNIKQNVSLYTRCFMTILSIIYQFILSTNVKVRPQFLFYTPLKNQFATRWPRDLLTMAVIINIGQFVFHSFPQYWYANLLSCVNMLFGILSIIFIIRHFQSTETMNWVLFFIIAGQFADLFDGRAARHFGGTKHGEMLDDAADFTSFGLATGLLIFKLLNVDASINTAFSFCLAIFYVICVAYRLVRFISDKKKEGNQGGVCFFNGMPSPCGSAITLLVSMIGQSQELFSNQLFQYGYIFGVIIVSLVMISHIRYPHFGRVFATHTFFTGKVRSLFITFMVASFIKATTAKDMIYAYIFMTSCIVLYIICPLIATRFDLYKTVTKLDSEDSDVLVTDFVKKETPDNRHEITQSED